MEIYLQLFPFTIFGIIFRHRPHPTKPATPLMPQARHRHQCIWAKRHLKTPAQRTIKIITNAPAVSRQRPNFPNLISTTPGPTLTASPSRISQKICHNSIPPLRPIIPTAHPTLQLKTFNSTPRPTRPVAFPATQHPRPPMDMEFRPPRRRIPVVRAVDLGFRERVRAA